MGGIGSYFELLVLSRLLNFKEQHVNNYIKDIEFNFIVYVNDEKYVEYDIAISTTYGALILIECKSSKFSRQAASAAINKANNLGGNYVQYICLIPTLGKDPRLERGAHVNTALSIWDNHKSVSAFQKNTYYLNNAGDEDTKTWDGFEMLSFDSLLYNNLLQKKKASATE